MARMKNVTEGTIHRIVDVLEDLSRTLDLGHKTDCNVSTVDRAKLISGVVQSWERSLIQQNGTPTLCNCNILPFQRST